MNKDREVAQEPQVRTAVSDLQIKYAVKQKLSELPTVKSSADLVKVVRDNWKGMPIEFVEQFYLIGLNRANKVKFVQSISTGGVSGTVVDVKVVAVMLLQAMCSGCAIAHNHPSGNMTPSSADITLTKKVQQAMEILDIRIVDHVILSPEEGGYYSFADEGRL